MNKILIFLTISMMILGGTAFYFVNDTQSGIKNTPEIDNLDIEYIAYSVGGGFGTMADCATKTITIKADGTVKFTNSYKKKLIKELNINEEVINQLVNYLNENRTIFSTGVKTENQAMDASSQYIVVKTKDGKEYKIGGYCVIDDRFHEMATKIIEAVGKEEFSNYRNEVRNSD